MLHKAETIKRYFTPGAVILLGATLLILLFWRGFSDPDEGRYSEIAREMISGGDWLEMRMLGYRYYEKPPLTYWLVAPAIRLCGAHDWAARLPLLLAAIVNLALLAALIRKHWPSLTGGGSALFAAISTFGFLSGITLLLTDAFLMLWFNIVCVALFEGFQAGADGARRRCCLLLAAVAAAMGFLTKGAVAVVLPAAILGLWLLWERRLQALLTPALIPAALLFFVFLAPLLLAIEQHNPGFFQRFIYEEHLARFTGTREAQLHPEPFWYFFMIAPLLLLPWTLFAPRAARAIAICRALQTDSLTRFLLVWAAVVIVFFSISTGKLMSYILPAIVPLGLLLGRWGIAEPLQGSAADRRLWILGASGLFSVALGIGAIWLVSALKIVPEEIYSIRPLSAIGLLPLAVTLALLLKTRSVFNFPALMLFNAGILLTMALLLSPLAGKNFNVLIHINSSIVYKQLAAALKPKDIIVVPWSYRPALPFYTERLYVPFQVKNELEYGMLAEPERRDDLQTADELRDLVANAPGRVFAVIEPMDTKKFDALNLPSAPAGLAGDPDTIILELLRAPR